MRLLGACLWSDWVQSMRLLGAKYAVVGCMYMDTIGCMYAAFGCKFHTAESLPDSRWLHSPRVSYILGPGAPRPLAQGVPAPAPGPKFRDSGQVLGRAGSALAWGGNQAGGWGRGAWGLGKAAYSQAKLPTVRQSYLLSGKATYCQTSTQPFHRLAPNNRILCTQQPHTLHPTVS